jgi:hypothetical protein
MIKTFKIFGLILLAVLITWLVMTNTLITKNTSKSEKTLEVEETLNNIKVLKTEDIKMTSGDWHISNRECLEPIPNENSLFSSALAINDQYLALGDLKANRVLVYARNQNGKWQKTREILPPKNSTNNQVNYNFGYPLALDGNILVIGGDITKKTKITEVVNPLVYQTNLDTEAKVEKIALPIQEFVQDYSIAADKGKIIVVTTSQDRKPIWFSRFSRWVHKAYILSDGKVREILLPQNENEAVVTDIALKNNLLLIGFFSEFGNGGAWLLDLNSPQNKLLKLTFPNARLGLTIAISDQFAAVGSTSKYSYTISGYRWGKTLIRSIKNGSTTVIDGYGVLSLDKNILARKRFPKPGIVELEGEILEVFRLDENAIPHLIMKRNNVDDALVQNRLLITVQKTVSGQKICTEQVR